VGRNDMFETTLECGEAGGAFSWAVKALAKDIRFSAEVRMITAKGVSEPRVIAVPTRADEHMGTFAVKGAARLTLRYALLPNALIAGVITPRVQLRQQVFALHVEDGQIRRSRLRAQR
jgi:hypothetical protein